MDIETFRLKTDNDMLFLRKERARKISEELMGSEAVSKKLVSAYQYQGGGDAVSTLAASTDSGDNNYARHRRDNENENGHKYDATLLDEKTGELINNKLFLAGLVTMSTTFVVVQRAKQLWVRFATFLGFIVQLIILCQIWFIMDVKKIQSRKFGIASYG